MQDWAWSAWRITALPSSRGSPRVGGSLGWLEKTRVVRSHPGQNRCPQLRGEPLEFRDLLLAGGEESFIGPAVTLLFERVECIGIGLREGDRERQGLDRDAVLPWFVRAGPIATDTQRDQAVAEGGLVGHCEAGRRADGLHLAIGESCISGVEQPADFVLVCGLFLE